VRPIASSLEPRCAVTSQSSGPPAFLVPIGALQLILFLRVDQVAAFLLQLRQHRVVNGLIDHQVAIRGASGSVIVGLADRRIARGDDRLERIALLLKLSHLHEETIREEGGAQSLFSRLYAYKLLCGFRGPVLQSSQLRLQMFIGRLQNALKKKTQ